jgi:hypothetical protein
MLRTFSTGTTTSRAGGSAHPCMRPAGQWPRRRSVPCMQRRGVRRPEAACGGGAWLEYAATTSFLRRRNSANSGHLLPIPRLRSFHLPLPAARVGLVFTLSHTRESGALELWRGIRAQGFAGDERRGAQAPVSWLLLNERDSATKYRGAQGYK